MQFSSKYAIYNVKNPIPDFTKFKINGIWFLVVYASKNNRRSAQQTNEINIDDDDVEENEIDRITDSQQIELQRGKEIIFNTIRTMFLTQRRIILMGDWNHLKDEIVVLMDEVRASRLDTEPS